MPLYLSRFSYTAETWARLIENPEDRRTAAESYIESVGGTLHGFWYAFGAHDGYTLWEAPDNVSMAAVGIGIGNTGSIGVLVEAVPADRIVTAMVIWSQVGIAGYLLGPFLGGIAADHLGFAYLGLVPALAGILVLALFVSRAAPDAS
jgi:uncharacterized protein with GYD domain